MIVDNFNKFVKEWNHWNLSNMDISSNKLFIWYFIVILWVDIL